MATFDFQTLFDQLKKEVSSLAVSSVKEFKKEAEADGQNLLESLKQNLQNWTVELATGEISMNILKQKGMALIDLDKLKISLINQLIKTTLSVI
jgi:F0F1-type ATP synthase membrane subunit b/b'